MNQKLFSSTVKLSKNVKTMIQRHNLLSTSDRVLVAVSGGPDSVALLHLLYSLRDEMALHLEVAHLDHGIRGSEAKNDARFVRILAERLCLPFHLKEIDIPRMRSQANKGNIEALARRERYRFLTEVARQQNLDKIATAHTQDDQAETVLMWLLRGTGGKGLGGMAPRQAINLGGAESSKELTIIRPVLGVAKEELVRFLDMRNLEYRLDRSNEDTVYLRNWIRFDLLPRLEDRIDPGVPSRLAQLAEVMRDEEAFLNALARQELDALSANRALRRDRFLRRPKAMQRRILRLWIERSRGDLRGLDFVHVEALRNLICDGPPQSRLSIPGGWQLIRQYETLRLAKRGCNSKKPWYMYPMIIDGLLAVPEAGVMIDCRVSHAPVELPKDHWEAVFDRAALVGPLVVRNFLRGDRFRPLGMAGGHKKVKDLFIEKKAPSPERALLPLLVMGAEVLWLPGYARSEIGRIGPDTTEVLCVRVVSRPH